MVAQLRRIWPLAPPTMLTPRLVVPLEWASDGGDKLPFTCIISGWNALDPYWVVDLHPADREAWKQLAIADGMGM